MRSAQSGKLDKADAEGTSNGKNATEAGDPDTVELLEESDILRHSLRHDNGEFGVRITLTFFSFVSQPSDQVRVRFDSHRILPQG